MKIWRTSAAAVALATVLAGGVLAAQDRNAPESLLPPGFGDPVPAPAPAPAPADRPAAPAPAPAQPGAIVQPLPGPPLPDAAPSPTPTPTATPLTAQQLLEYELPAYARRSTTRVGAIDAVPANGFGASDGRYLQTLMRRMNTPVASRWMAIALRRMLMSRLDTPAGVNGADFAAERAWLLLRMGEAAAARHVVQAVDTENYTPKLFQVAMQVALATGDPAALCPLEALARQTSSDPAWRLAEPICAGLAGEPRRAGAAMDAARRARAARGIDLLLAEKVMGTGAQGQRAVTIEWDDVQQLTAWRYGLAVATGVAVPDNLLSTVRPHVRGWYATSPMVPPHERMRAADLAASWGILSNLALVDLWGQVEESDEASAADASLARDLRAAYTAATPDERMTALRQLWTGPTGPRAQFARSILTARAAARIDPAETLAADAPALIASMLTAGLDRPAARWRPYLAEGSDGWAMVALTDPGAPGMVSASVVNRYRAGADAHKAQLFLAGMAGTGRIAENQIAGLAQSFDMAIGMDNSWVRAIRRAAEAREAATVVLLAAVGMQTPDWRGVSPVALFHITAALTAVGMEGEARMIAAEAIARS
ncbi:hypothetical protein [Sphingomonas sp.]